MANIFKESAKQFILKSLWAAAQRVLRADRPYIIAVTGSVGKTTTKDAIIHLLPERKGQVRGTSGNMNTEFTVPLVICGQNKPPRRAGQWLTALLKARFTKTAGFGKHYTLVLEFASEQAGDIAYLAERIPFDMAVFTRFVLSHAGSNMAEITAEKLSLLKGLKENGVIVANADDEWQRPLLKDKRTLTYGVDQADLTYTKPTQEGTGTAVTFAYRKESYRAHTRLLGQHQLSSLAAALAVGVGLNYKLSALLPYTETFTGPPGRMRLITGKKAITIIDDSYNSSPAAAEEALTTLSRLAEPGHRTVAILGNMNALGANTVSAHINLGQAVAQAKIDYLVAVGPNAKRLVRGAREGGMASQRFITFTTPATLIARLDNIVQAKDIILVKASQNGMFFERVVKALMLHPEQAKSLLVRQDYH